MNLVVWNSQGAKWDTFWTSYINPLLASGQDVVGLLVESGWAPWVTSGDVTINALYSLESEVTWYDGPSAANSAFCQGVKAKRRLTAFWIPWAKNLDAMKTNTRCSMGGILMPASRVVVDTTRFLMAEHLRPVLRILLGKPANQNYTPDFTILLVHLISGRPIVAQNEMNDLIGGMQSLISQGTSGVIVGDMNVDLQPPNVVPALPDRWRYLRTNQATQQSGGELDYAVLYDPNQQYTAAAATVVQSFKTGNNQSDHAVMQYNIPFS